MKMVILIFHETWDEEIQALLKTCVQAEYTKWTKATGWGQHSLPQLMDAVWPGSNHVMLLGVEDGKARKIMEAVRELRLRLKKGGVKAFQLPLDDVT